MSSAGLLRRLNMRVLNPECSIEIGGGLLGGLEYAGRNVHTDVCTWCTVKTAKVFKSGNSQAVRIPKEFQLNEGEVQIRRRGDALILEPRKRSWTPLFESLDKFTDDFMADGRTQPALQKRRRTF